MNTDKIIKFTNCDILRNHKIIHDDIWIRNGKIIDPQRIFYIEKKSPDCVIDCGGALISPGFIDIQINGGFGVDFSVPDDTKGSVDKVAKLLLSTGVTAFCPTLVSSKPEVYQAILPEIQRRVGGESGAAVLGVHVEGPFINKEKKGAHLESNLEIFNEGAASLYNVYGCLDNVILVTLAPELENSLNVIQHLHEKRIVVSLGHSMADINTAEAAIKCGASMVTHIFNAMAPFHHRDPGLVGLLASDCILSLGKSIYYGLICDGHHTHASAIRIAYRTHFPGLILVTDAVSALGYEEGIHHIGDQVIEIKDGAGYIANTRTLCGGINPMNKCIQILKSSSCCSIVEALEAATLHPAQALGIQDQKGTLNFGADADMVFLDPAFNVTSTWIAGNCVFRNKV